MSALLETCHRCYGKGQIEAPFEIPSRVISGFGTTRTCPVCRGRGEILPGPDPAIPPPSGSRLTVAEARVILRADEALDLTYETRVAAGTTIGIEESEAWIKIVEEAQRRVATHTHEALYGNWKSCPACEKDPDPRGPTACFECRRLNMRELR